MLLNNCDAVKAKEVPLTARAPFLEYTVSFLIQKLPLTFDDLTG